MSGNVLNKYLANDSEPSKKHYYYSNDIVKIFNFRLTKLELIN